MNNLKQSGLNLRNINVVDYAQLVEDIQYNFLQILSHPGFKGVPGKSIKGDTGVGVRGSKWIFVKVEAFPNETISSINLQFINNEFARDAAAFTSKLLIPDNSGLIHGDILVLPSGAVIQLIQDKATGKSNFIDIGVSFSQISTLSAEEVTKLVTKLTENITKNTGNVFVNAVGKNYHDSSPAGNINATNDAIIDVVTSTSGPGKVLENKKYFVHPELIVNDDTDVMAIVGSAQAYHKLVQNTLATKNANYGPGVDDWATLALLQSSYKNAIILGHKNSQTLQKFARIYKDENALVLTSSYSPYQNEFSDIQITDNIITLRANNEITIRSPFFNIQSSKLNSAHFSYENARLELGSNVTNVIDLATKQAFNISGKTYLKDVKGAQFLSTTADGLIQSSAITVTNSVDNAGSNNVVNGVGLKTKFKNVDDKIDREINDINQTLLELIGDVSKDIVNIRKEHDKLKQRLKSTVPIGLVAIWGKPASQIPEGWEEYTPLSGKMPIGVDKDYVRDYWWHAEDYKLQKLNHSGGELSHIMTIDEMPAHNHKQGSEALHNLYGGGNLVGLRTWGYATANNAYIQQNTSATGNNKPHNNMPPYRVVEFIRFVGFSD